MISFWFQPLLTVVVDYVLDVTHDLSISTLGDAGLLVDRLCIFLEHGCWLRMQDKRNCEKTLRTNQHPKDMSDKPESVVP